MKPKIPTTISRLLAGDYFIPHGEETVYRYRGYDSQWELWIAVDIIDGKVTLFDDMLCVWLPGYEFLN